MQVLLITSTNANNQNIYVESMNRGGIELDCITPCTYKDAKLFINDAGLDIIFVEILANYVEEGMSNLEAIKKGAHNAKIVPILQKKDSDLILSLMKKGCSDVLIYPISSDEISTLIKDIAVSSSKATKNINKGNAKIISFTSYKGGTGVSTVASNIGFCLSELDNLKKKTLIIDLANQSNHCAMLLGVNISLTINQICQNIKNLGVSYIASSCSWITDTLALIGSDISTNSVIEQLDFDSLVHAFGVLSEIFDYIIVDVPTHAFDSRFLASIEVSNQIVVLSTLDVTSISDTKNYMNLFKELGIEKSKMRILINRYDCETVNFKPQELEKAIESPISFYIRNDYFTIASASQARQSIIEFNPKCMLAEDFAELAVGIDSGSAFIPFKKTAKKTEKNGLFANLLGLGR